ncbi:MAG: hypothetical protein L6461_24050 [Anaerolineae bacterium]|nr:hypothetical protein [Anaerolineae bacterium]
MNQQPRRSFLEELPPAPQEHVHSIPAPAPAPGWGRKPAHQRDRKWESKHKNKTFAGVPQEIQSAILDLAAHFRDEFGMVGGADAVARELLRYALAEYEAGYLKMPTIQVSPTSTLKSHTGSGLTSRSIPPRKAKKKKSKEQPHANYRLPEEIIAAIYAIPNIEKDKAAPHVIHITIGQVMTCLLTYALAEYRAGNLALYTTPEMVVPGLAAGRSE